MYDVSRMGEGTSVFKILTAKPTRGGSLGTPRRRWEDNIRMDLKETGVSKRNWINSAQDRDCDGDIKHAYSKQWS
jgi:hypothetical protein